MSILQNYLSHDLEIESRFVIIVANKKPERGKKWKKANHIIFDKSWLKDWLSGPFWWIAILFKRSSCSSIIFSKYYLKLNQLNICLMHWKVFICTKMRGCPKKKIWFAIPVFIVYYTSWVKVTSISLMLGTSLVS